ncbi:hypothetical protein [Allochromatium tepidum]|uniref:Uncharacterized protein n=1 Tax=Allochromatium tepidum TaxID=553982 RepID=A0ABN6GAA6_9GAMM|nr:hypothetical protein [Allochromatium tepidum]BCU06848.1 hypothetical protein Atep_15250 [Allochromatium tepidum]
MVVQSIPPPTPELSPATLVARVREVSYALPDARKGGNHQRYAMGDAGLSAFAMVLMQSPSFLDFQRRMQYERGANNAATLFGVDQIPSDQHSNRPSLLHGTGLGAEGGMGAFIKDHDDGVVLNLELLALGARPSPPGVARPR